MSQALKRINDLMALVASENDMQGSKLLKATLLSAHEYVATVNRMETTLKSSKFRLEADEYRDLVMELDKRRRIAHDALLSSCSAINRYLRNKYQERCPEGGIFGISKERLQEFDRHVAGDWAGEISAAMFEGRQIRREKPPMSHNEEPPSGGPGIP